ncbi:MAG: 30S ribosome-binding factor RbfA [Deltaproteobacteria bacterium]|nr:30S ribosome-binding factor RbfA [Deltaproteobacteria bacterium]
MHIHRRLKLQSVIQKELAYQVPRSLKDPRVPWVTFTAVELNQSGSRATVYVALTQSIKEDNIEPNKKMQKCLKGLTAASGFLRKLLSKALMTKYVPELFFKEDKGLENSIRVFELLKTIQNENQTE